MEKRGQQNKQKDKTTAVLVWLLAILVMAGIVAGGLYAREYLHRSFLAVAVEQPDPKRNEHVVRVTPSPRTPPMRDRHSSQPVTLVPTLAPRMMGMDWIPFIMPEFTKPMTMMVVADELWMAAVTPRPSSAPLMGVLLSRQRMTSSLFPATRLSPSPMTDMP